MKSAHVFIQTAFLGDVILSVPFLQNWNYILGSNKKKIIICRQGVGSFLKQLGLVDEVIEVKKGDAGSYRKALEEIKEYEIETLISAHQSFRTSLFVWQVKARQKIGYKNFLSKFVYSHTIERQVALPEPLRLLQLLIPIDPSIEGLLTDFHHNQFSNDYKENLMMKPPPHWARSQMRAAIEKSSRVTSLFQELNLDEKKRWIAIFPGSVWATKRWTESGFIMLTRHLLSSGFGVLLMGGPDEWNLCQGIVANTDSVRRTHLVNLAGKTSLMKGLGLLTRCELAISNDSAGAHLASLAEIKVLAIFGPTVLDFGYRPWADETYIVEQKNLFCRPCGPHGHKKCPIGTHACMKEISAEVVMNAVGTILS